MNIKNLRPSTEGVSAAISEAMSRSNTRSGRIIISAKQRETMVMMESGIKAGSNDIARAMAEQPSTTRQRLGVLTGHKIVTKEKIAGNSTVFYAVPGWRNLVKLKG